MTKENQGPEPVTIPAEIHALLEQRATFQAWLGKLGGLRQKFRPEVASRVEEDYRARLTKVESELASHRTDIERALGQRRTEAAELTDLRDAQAAELEEVELRYAVGELPERDWERLRREHEEALAGLERSIEAERKAVGELEAILADLAGERAGRPARPAPSLRPAPAAAREERGERRQPAVEKSAAAEPPEEVAEEVGEEAGEEAGVEEPAGAGGEDLLDELEFLDSLALEDAGRFDAVSRMLDESEDRGPGR